MNIMSWRANFLNLEERKNLLTEKEDAEDFALDIQCWEIREDGSCVGGQNPGTVYVLKILNIFFLFSNKMLFWVWNSQNDCQNSKQGRP